MRKLRIIFLIITTCCTYALYGQQGSPSPESDNTAPADTNAAALSGGAQAAVNDTTGAGSATAGQAANVAPTDQESTSSQSGSPAVLSGERGSDRDGTNNVQRASMNMVGSPVKNLDIDDERPVDPDTEMRDRQEYTQEKQQSAQGDAPDNASAPITSGTEGAKGEDGRSQRSERSDQKRDRKKNKKEG